MNRKKTLSTLAMLLFATTHTVADNKVMVVNGSSGSPVAVSLSQIRSVKFAGSSIQLFLLDESVGTLTIAYDGQSSIKFADEAPTGIDLPKANKGAEIAYAGNTLSAKGLDGASVTLYGVDGRQVMHFADWDGSPVNLATLSKGVYVLKVNNQSFKILKK